VGKKLFFSACAAVLAVSAVPANATEVISQSLNNYSYGSLCAMPYQGGGCQTTSIGESFTASITGQLTNFQFTVNSGNLAKLVGQVYTLDGSGVPGTLLWQSDVVTNPMGLLDFNPTGINLTAGTKYVAFLSTFGLSGNTGTASLGDTLSFVYGTNNIPYLGELVQDMLQGANLDEHNYATLNYHDLTFSATIAPVPEAATWSMMLAGFGALGFAMRRRRVAVSFA
jgi:hypothetical protein